MSDFFDRVGNLGKGMSRTWKKQAARRMDELRDALFGEGGDLPDRAALEEELARLEAQSGGGGLPRGDQVAKAPRPTPRGSSADEEPSVAQPMGKIETPEAPLDPLKTSRKRDL
jgi:hypothetical protein